VKKHEAGTASRYTRARLPVELVWSRRVRTWGKALREEHRIKGLKRREKEDLVTGGRARA
jgi:putative endonuclease